MITSDFQGENQITCSHEGLNVYIRRQSFQFDKPQLVRLTKMSSEVKYCRFKKR